MKKSESANGHYFEFAMCTVAAYSGSFGNSKLKKV